MRMIIAASAAAAVLLTSGVSSVTDAARAAPTTVPVQVTKRIVVRPVTATGRPAAGFTVARESIPGFACDGGASAGAVDPDIRFCGFSATYTVACWKSTNHTVLCLRDPASRRLVRIRYDGGFTHVAAPRRPTPQSLRLGNGEYCTIRDGGAWSIAVRHPFWVGDYSCTRDAVYGPPNGDGVDRSHPLWTVYTLAPSGRGPVTRRRVLTAYFVGTAR